MNKLLHVFVAANFKINNLWTLIVYKLKYPRFIIIQKSFFQHHKTETWYMYYGYLILLKHLKYNVQLNEDVFYVDLQIVWGTSTSDFLPWKWRHLWRIIYHFHQKHSNGWVLDINWFSINEYMYMYTCTLTYVAVTLFEIKPRRISQ